jgi:hypothetical protein
MKTVKPEHFLWIMAMAQLKSALEVAGYKVAVSHAGPADYDMKLTVCCENGRLINVWAMDDGEVLIKLFDSGHILEGEPGFDKVVYCQCLGPDAKNTGYINSVVATMLGTVISLYRDNI